MWRLLSARISYPRGRRRNGSASGGEPMTCSACLSGGEEDDPETLLDGVTNERTLVLRIEIHDETHIVTLRQDNSSERYQSIWQHGNGQRDQKTRGRTAVVALVGEIVHSDSYIGSKYGPVEEIWPYPADNRVDVDGSEGEQQ
jgi:hypothetical protein